MKKILKYPLLLLTGILLPGCQPSGDDCTKTINIPQYHFDGNQSHSIDNFQEVPCDYPEPTEPGSIETATLENFSYEVLHFEFTPDTGNNTSRLQFEIKLNNLNDHAVSGVPVLTIIRDGLETTGSYSNNASVPCYEIEENSSCILTYDQQNSLDHGMIDSIELINVEYSISE